jgi:3-hydroxybutyryl-CoA dehydrogenase
MMRIGVLGAGTMGSGIAQVAATAGHEVMLIDASEEQILRATASLDKIFSKLVEKEKITVQQRNAILCRIKLETDIAAFHDCGLVIEAIVEDLTIKKEVFARLETFVSDSCILASNTSSLSIASIGSALKKPERIIGIHFFNPAPLMPLVEVVPAVQTSAEVLEITKNLIDSWKKVTVLTKDTPGFIVNRIARPFYGEALRIYEEGIADFATIDWAMMHFGQFKMGPFTLMDYIGNDVNYAVTESVFAAFYYDPRYKPSLTQKRYSEAGYLGRKSGRGYYNYSENASNTEPNRDEKIGYDIFERILVMLMNEAADALFLNIASKQDIDLAMTKGVNYPKGLLAWAEEFGIEKLLQKLETLQEEYGEDRYRPSPLLKRMVKNKQTTF